MPPKKRKGLQRLLKGKGGLPGLHRASVDPIRRAALLNESQRNLNVPAAVRGSGAPAPACRLTSPSDAFHSYARWKRCFYDSVLDGSTSRCCWLMWRHHSQLQHALP